MGRRPGSKNKTTLMKEQGILNVQTKKVIKNNTVKQHIKELSTKVGKPVMPKYVLKLNNWLYITCDSHCWMIREVNDKINPSTGEKYPDKSLLYASTLNGILQVAVNYMIRISADIETLSNKVNEIYELIDSRIPEKTKPKDLFEVYQVVDDSED